MDNAILRLTVTTDGISWIGSASITSIALWIAGPPLVLWVLWMATRTRSVPARERVL
jgi:hypothetical protein